MKLWDLTTGKGVRAFKHTDLVAAVSFSQDGKKALSGSYDKSLKLWDLSTGMLIQNYSGHTNDVMSVAFHPLEETVLSASFDGTLKLWDQKTAKNLRTFKGHAMGVNTAAFNPDGKQILSGSYDSTLKLWDTNSGNCIKTFKGHKGGVTNVLFLPNGRFAISSSYDSTLKLWDLSSGTCLRTFRSHTKGVTYVSLSPDGKQALSSSYDKTVKLWNVQTGNCLHTFKGHTDEVACVVFHPNGEKAISGSLDNTMKYWEMPIRPSRLVHSEVNKKIAPWLVRGKYETSTAYNTRVNENARRLKAETIAQPLIDSMAKIKTDDFTVILNDYDSDNQLFSLSFESPEVLPFHLSVPVKEAELFENNLDTIEFRKAQFTLTEQEEFVLWHVEAYNPLNAKTYVFDKSALRINPLSFTFAPPAVEAKTDHTRVQLAATPNLHAPIGKKPPQIEVIQPRVERGKQYHVEEKKMTVKGNVKTEAGIFLLLVNGVETSVNPDGTFQTDVHIGYNENTILFKAIDKQNQVGLDSISVFRAFNNAKSIIDSRKGIDYALVIASDDYIEYKDLSNPIYDGMTMAKELETNYGFKVETIKNPTHAELYTVLRNYSKRQFSDEDQLFIFVAGHGEYDPVFSEGYIVTTDSKKNDEIKESFVSHSNIRTIVNNIPCKHILLTLDVCFGGTFDQSITNTRGGDDNPTVLERERFIKRKLAFTTRKYLTSGGKEYVPDGRPGFHSPFASKLLEALRTYGGEDKILTFNELYSHVERAVPGPKTGEFGNNQPGSDFLFIAK